MRKKPSRTHLFDSNQTNVFETVQWSLTIINFCLIGKQTQNLYRSKGLLFSLLFKDSLFGFFSANLRCEGFAAGEDVSSLLCCTSVECIVPTVSNEEGSFVSRIDIFSRFMCISLFSFHDDTSLLFFGSSTTFCNDLSSDDKTLQSWRFGISRIHWILWFALFHCSKENREYW